MLSLFYKQINRGTVSCSNEIKLHHKKTLVMIKDMESNLWAFSIKATLFDMIILVARDVSDYWTVCLLECAAELHFISLLWIKS